MSIACRITASLVLLAACSNPQAGDDDHIVIRTDRRQYTMLQRDEIRLSAHIPRTLPVYVYRYSAFLLLNYWDGREWQRLPAWYSPPPPESERTAFTDGDRDIWARDAIVPDLEQTAGLPGRYRFELLWYTGPEPAPLFSESARTSNPFTIVP
jgi:hypothetical protein